MHRLKPKFGGKPWVQPSFKYQLKCLRWTRREFASLDEPYQASVRVIFAEVGLLPLAPRYTWDVPSVWQ